ncbi:MAG: radical SAM protein [Dehalococcoidia bacterium]|nr:radical SAM protein [Dehalococcoidia bacterium]
MTAASPRYVSLYHSGELERRAKLLEARLERCDICPRQCRLNRLEGERGFCHSGYLPVVSAACAHFGEEPVISGSRGSGTVFFGNCNMRCVYCQNHQISQDWERQESRTVSFQELAGRMLRLQDELGCHNINLVSPSHFVPQIVRALLYAVPMGLRLPLVYNSNGYDSLATLKSLDGIIDIYLPDLRYASDGPAVELSGAPGYVDAAREAVREMYRQVGNIVLDREGAARRGLIVRHLILPGGLAGTAQTLDWLAKELSRGLSVSIMSQYYPAHRAREHGLSRQITAEEYADAVRALHKAGIETAWVQGMGSPEVYLPDFEREESPFVAAGEG